MKTYLLNKEPRHERELWSGGVIHALLTSALDGDKWLDSRSDSFTPSEAVPRTH
jgi:hypothetical protein